MASDLDIVLELRKRKEIVAKAIEDKFKIFNARVSASGSKS